MHNQGGMGESSSMDHDTHLTHHDQSFCGDHWSDMGTFMPTPMSEYAHGYSYLSSLPHRLPSESLGQMAPPATSPPPPPPSLHGSAPAHHPTLPMLMVPGNPTWPSMLTNPGGFTTSPPVAIPPMSAGVQPLTQSRPPMPPVASQPRKTLTDEDRRRMCQWHIDHPEMKQTEIGGMFGVERSTVSKVLSRKDKWLHQEERSNSPIKKAKGKIPDIDKTLANWLRNEQHRGRHVSDAEIQEQARMYARPFREAETKINNPSWLEKFKHKHGMMGGSRGLTRRASETNIASCSSAAVLARMSTTTTTPTPTSTMTTSPVLLPDSQPSSAISSASPVARLSVSPFSGLHTGGEDEKDGGGNGSIMMDFNDPPSAGSRNHFKQNHNPFHSDTTGSTFSDHTVSPTGTSQFTFSPDPNVGGFLSSGHARPIPPGEANFQRPRSQTFPTLDLEYMSQHSSEQMTPRVPSSGHPSSCTAPSSALESPPAPHDFGPPNPAVTEPFGLNGAISPHHSSSLHHSSSASSLQGRSMSSQQQQQQHHHQQHPAGTTCGSSSSTTPIIGSAAATALSSSVASSPVSSSPSQEDARRAADTLLSFIAANAGPNSLVDQSDYHAVIRLTEKLRLAQAAAKQQQQQIMGMGAMGMGGIISMGGLDRIPEGDAEMGNTGALVGEVSLVGVGAIKREMSG